MKTAFYLKFYCDLTVRKSDRYIEIVLTVGGKKKKQESSIGSNEKVMGVRTFCDDSSIGTTR